VTEIIETHIRQNEGLQAGEVIPPQERGTQRLMATLGVLMLAGMSVWEMGTAIYGDIMEICQWKIEYQHLQPAP